MILRVTSAPTAWEGAATTAPYAVPARSHQASGGRVEEGVRRFAPGGRWLVSWAGNGGGETAAVELPLNSHSTFKLVHFTQNTKKQRRPDKSLVRLILIEKKRPCIQRVGVLYRAPKDTHCSVPFSFTPHHLGWLAGSFTGLVSGLVSVELSSSPVVTRFSFTQPLSTIYSVGSNLLGRPI